MTTLKMKRTILFTTLTCLILFIGFNSFCFDKNAILVQDILTQTNQFRKSKGLSALTIKNELNSLAQKHSADMASGRIGFGHGGFAKRNAMAGKIMKPLFSFAENVAYGASSAREVITMWKNSSGHRRNMLGQYKYIGIGVARDKKGNLYYTQFFAG